MKKKDAESMTIEELKEIIALKEMEKNKEVIQIGYLKHDLFDYDPFGNIDFEHECWAKTKKCVDEHVAAEISLLKKKVTACISLCMKKGTKFIKTRDGLWNVEEDPNEHHLWTSLEDSNDKWAKENLENIQEVKNEANT